MKKEIIVNVVILLFCFFMLHLTNQLPKPTNTVELGAGYFPKLILYVIIFFNGLQILSLLFSKSAKTDSESNFNPLHIFLMIILMGAYVFSLSFVDYRIATFLFIFAVMFLLGVRSYKVLFSVSTISIASIFLVFDVLLNVPMP